MSEVLVHVSFVAGITFSFFLKPQAALTTQLRPSDHSAQRVGKGIGRMWSILHKYNQVNGVRGESGTHTRRSTLVDFNKILQQLQKSEVFDYKPGRKHRNFPTFSSNLVKTISHANLKEWMQDRLQKLIIYH